MSDFLPRRSEAMVFPLTQAIQYTGRYGIHSCSNILNPTILSPYTCTPGTVRFPPHLTPLHESSCVCERERKRESAYTQTHKAMCIYTDMQNCSAVPFSMLFCVGTSCLVFLKFSSFFILISSNFL